jgi:hypothetical protein
VFEDQFLKKLNQIFPLSIDLYVMFLVDVVATFVDSIYLIKSNK